MNDEERPSPRPFEIVRLRDDMRVLFQKYLPDELRKRSVKVRVLSVGCGFAQEAAAVVEAIPQVEYLGIDLDAARVHGAQDFNLQFLSAENFRQADATNLESFQGGSWDLIIIRNPQIGERLYLTDPAQDMREDWRQIFRNSVQSLSREGYILLTTTTIHEMQSVTSFFKNSLMMKEFVQPQEIDQTAMQSKFPLRETQIAVFRKQ